MKLLVSACLMGVGCRYDGKSNELPQLAELLSRHHCIPACAEVFGSFKEMFVHLLELWQN